MRVNEFQLRKSIADKFVSNLCKKVSSYHSNYNLKITSVRLQLFLSNKRLKLKLKVFQGVYVSSVTNYHEDDHIVFTDRVFL